MHPVSQLFDGIPSIVITLFLLVVGILIVVFILKLLVVLVPAGIIALIVWWLTGSTTYAGIAFLVIAVLGFLKR